MRIFDVPNFRLISSILKNTQFCIRIHDYKHLGKIADPDNQTLKIINKVTLVHYIKFKFSEFIDHDYPVLVRKVENHYNMSLGFDGYTDEYIKEVEELLNLFTKNIDNDIKEIITE
ncbi:MAG: hypothetical protein ACO1O1_13210 [Adhaeribacter sp.]